MKTVSLNPAITSLQHVGNLSETDYHAYLEMIQTRFDLLPQDQPLFKTDIKNLYDVFLKALPIADRQHYNCNACRRFVETYGDLATIDNQGELHSAFWHVSDAYGVYVNAVKVMLKAISESKITSVFYSSDKNWGTSKTGVWRHLGIKVSSSSKRIFKDKLKTDFQMSAEKSQDYLMLITAVRTYSLDTIDQAVVLLNSESLYRSEKILGSAKWLRGVKASCKMVRTKKESNLLWKAVASAPTGFCHVKNSMIGTLLEDIQVGKSFEDVSRAFSAKMNPTQYQRPQAAPKAGNITQAQKIFDKLGAASALKRRYATFGDVDDLWTPRKIQASTVKTPGLFSDVVPKKTAIYVPKMDLPPVKMTWEKFERTVLPTSEKIELFTKTHDNYAVLVTATDPYSIPILQWDFEDSRNPVSWYVWNGGSRSSDMTVLSRTYVPVTLITRKPSEWGSRKIVHHGEGIIFALEGAQESKSAGLALFPEILKSELREVSSVIEAYSRQGTITKSYQPMVIGPMIVNGQACEVRLRVISHGQRAVYDLDRWD